ncbi:hypothetical protein QCA50_000548 [Cerrena zonata]|uniref:Uncharacterized protein n=1 Tax=Cerrena zonata TaxID=2478898 RepID=A0AAW0GV32_9APHY
MPSYSAFSAVTLVLKTLFIISPDSSAWNTFLIWLLRLITISFLFRTFLGPTILRLITKRLRVRSVSLRSIRGIYFHAGKAIIRIDRVGLSYHQRSTQTASRFSIKVEGLKVEMLRKQICKPVSPPTSMDPNKRSLSSKFRPSPIVQGLLSFLQSIYWAIYTFLDPYVRPLVRSYIVSALRVAIRALPAVTQILDLELVDATVVADNIDGAQLALRGASLNTSVELSQIHAPPEPQESKEAIKPGHKRFNSVVQWNARLKSSMRRSWDRAWGALEAHTSVTLKVEEISGTASQSLLERLKINSSGGNKLDFLKVPQFTFSLSACLDPRHGIQQHSLEVGLNLESIAIDLFVISRMVELLKTPPPVNPMVAASLAALGRKSTTPGSTPRVGWASSMSVLTASMRFRRGLKKPPVRKLDTRAIASKLSILKGVQVNVTRITLRHRVELGPNDNLATLNTTLRRVNIYAALSNPDSNPLHREWLGRNSNRGSDPLSAHVYECGFTIRETALDRIGSGAVSDHLRLLELGPLTAEAVSSQWPAPWLRGPSFFAGDPNAQVLLVQISLDKVQITERLEVLQALISHRKPKKPTPHSTEPSLR